MKSLFFKRAGAYILDFIIVGFLVSIVTVGFKVNNATLNEINDLFYEAANEEISDKEYSNRVIELYYEYQKSIVSSTIVNVIVSFGYFVVFACLNKGQTLGKKIFKIKVVDIDGQRPNIWNMLGRSIWLYQLFIGIFSIIGVYVFNPKMFDYSSIIITYVYYIFIIICFFMALNRKDGRGLHDIIGRTRVIGEVK